jgi:2,3-bisphosphoglycerate-dependent phosphoglycerate mutase
MKYLLSILTLVVTLAIQAQESTTFILVRHAEKAADDPKDPSLSKEGEERAQDLKEILAQSGISVIYSTPFKRTNSTIEPIAGLLKLEIMEYMPNDPKSLAAEWLTNHQGATILVSGHSNTTPSIANALIGEEKYPQLDDSDYGNILIVTIPPKGKASHFILRY